MSFVIPDDRILICPEIWSASEEGIDARNDFDRLGPFRSFARCYVSSHRLISGWGVIIAGGILKSTSSQDEPMC